MALLSVQNVSKTFKDHDYRVHAVRNASLEVHRGEMIAIIGPSGSGKTTLLRCLNFLEQPDNGMIRVKDKTVFDAANPTTMQESEIRKNRLHFGLVFQSFNLFPQYTARKIRVINVV